MLPEHFARIGKSLMDVDACAFDRTGDDDRRDDQDARQSGRTGREHHVRQFRRVGADSYRFCRKAGRRGRIRSAVRFFGIF